MCVGRGDQGKGWVDIIAERMSRGAYTRTESNVKDGGQGGWKGYGRP